MEERIGKYRILELLGSGAFADVFLAEDPITKRRVAIKRCSAVGSKRESLLSECRLLVQLDHANIVNVYDADVVEPHFIIVMEYMAGGSLREVINNAKRKGLKVSTELACKIIMNILNALSFAHSMNVVHRDVKPENILFSADKKVKLGDFGIAKMLETTQGAAYTRIGTVPYMAPEQLLGRAVFQSDIYACGVVLYEIITGVRAFDGDTDYVIMKKIESADFTRPRAIRPDIPEWLEGVIMRAMAKDTDRRYRNAGDMIKDIRSGIESKTISGGYQPDIGKDMVQKGVRGSIVALSEGELVGREEHRIASTGSLIWRYKTGGWVNSSPTISGGRVYVGSWDNYIYCLSSDSGDLIWRFKTGGIVFSSPCVVDGRVYVGSGDCYIYCLSADSGDIIWRYETDYGLCSSPAIVNGRVYVGSHDGYIYCLSADNGDLIWRYETESFLFSSPAIVDGRIYVRSDDGYIYCLSADNGDLIWRYGIGGNVVSSPAILGGKVYVGSWDGYIYCLSADSGNLIWRYKTGGAVDYSQAVVGSRVYVGSYDNYIYCLSADSGDIIWRYETDYGLCSSPAIVNGRVYVGSHDGYIYCLSADSGDLIWRYEIGGSVVLSLAISGGRVYVGSCDNYIYCLEGMK